MINNFVMLKLLHSCWDVARLGQAYGIARRKNYLSSSCLPLIDYLLSLIPERSILPNVQTILFKFLCCAPLIDYILSLKLR